jgi:hypothetical protein
MNDVITCRCNLHANDDDDDDDATILIEVRNWSNKLKC